MGSGLLVCEHVAGANPRFHHDDGTLTCCKCGRTFRSAATGNGPVMERDREFEQRILREASAKLGMEFVADALRNASDRRTREGPVRLDRDLVLEAIEECLDGSGNYIVWELQRMMVEGDDDHERRAALWEALQLGIMQYAALLRARA